MFCYIFVSNKKTQRHESFQIRSKKQNRPQVQQLRTREKPNAVEILGLKLGLR
jgi:hypothetical protein